jgi:hypothetical protein
MNTAAITVYEVRLYNTLLNYWYTHTINRNRLRAEQIANRQENLGFQSDIVAVVVD